MGEREAPLWNIQNNVCDPFLVGGGGSASELVELGIGGVTVSREPACPAALHPRCGIVDICPGSCLKVGY